MENLAHTLLGIAIADAAFSRRLGRRTALAVAIVAANLPDIDIVLYLFSRGGYLLWGFGYTHSLLACLLVPPLLALLAGRFARRGRFRDLWALAAVAYASNPLLDLTTGWGTMMLLPFDDSRLALGWVHMLDLLPLAILSAPLWLERVLPPRGADGVVGQRERLFRRAIGGLAAYVLACGALHTAAVHEVRAAAARQGVEVTEADAYPEPFLPFYWNGVATDGDLLYQGRVEVLGGAESVLRRVIPANATHPAVAAVLRTGLGDRFFGWWADWPYAEVRCAGEQPRFVLLRDLRHVSPWRDEEPFALVFELRYDEKARSYSVLRHFFSTQWTGEQVPDADCGLPARQRAAPPGGMADGVRAGGEVER